MDFVNLFVCFFVILTIKGIDGGFGPGEQDYGYVTVREGSHMFWWLFHTTANVTDSADRPLILWLEGGPGGSSCGHGNFLLCGPIDVDLQPREHNWVKDYNILFVDNPVGVGFSFVEELRFLSIDNNQIAKDLVELTKGFFRKVPKFKRVPFYVYGISYGGKMGADFVRLLYDEMQAGNVECDLRGVSMGDPWISPIDISLGYGPYLYQLGLVDEAKERDINVHFEHVKEVFDNGQYFHATIEWFRAMDLVQVLTDGVDSYDVRSKLQRSPTKYAASFYELLLKRLQPRDLNGLMNGPVKRALNIPSYVFWGMQTPYIFQYLLDDFMTPVTKTVESLLNETDVQVHVCNGNFDLIVNTPGTFKWINKLEWKDAADFATAERTTIWVNNTMEGYSKRGGRFNFYWINGAGHDHINGNPAGTRAFLKGVTGI